MMNDLNKLDNNLIESIKQINLKISHFEYSIVQSVTGQLVIKKKI